MNTVVNTVAKPTRSDRRDTLRRDQHDAIDHVRSEFRAGHNAVLLQCPTGWGKTHTVMHMAETAVARWKRVLFVAPLQEIALDVHARLSVRGRTGLALDGTITDLDAPIVVGLPWTLIERDTYPAADLVIWDEARHVISATYHKIRERYPHAKHLGLDATPERGDGTSLGDMFTAMVCGPSPLEMVEAGSLAPITMVAPGKARKGALICSPHAAWQRWGGSRPAIVFCSHVPHANEVAKPWGERAMVLTGKTPAKQRKAVRARIESKEIDALCVVKIGLEGFDCPPLGCAILARQFGVVSEYLQSIGRVRRVLPGKPSSVCIDLVGSVFLHGLPDEDRVWSLAGTAVRLKDPASSLSVRRCGECLAVFFPQSICPVCGASTAGDMKMPRTLSRVDQLAKLESVPVEIRDRAYLDKLRDVAKNRIRVPAHLVDIKAAELFRQRFKREPVCA